MIKVYTDGATEGHNGKLGTVTHCGIGIHCEKFNYSERIEAISNNEAEYHALIKGMEICLERGYKEVEFYCDSMIVVSGAKKDKRTNNERMNAFRGKVHLLKYQFDKVSFTWIPREKNGKADYLSKKCLK